MQLLKHHSELVAAAEKKGVVCFVEHHKRSVINWACMSTSKLIFLARFDPVYSDARAKAASLGEFNFFTAWMSQPKSQLETFRAWAGKDSDIRCVTPSRTQSLPRVNFF